MSFHTIYEDPSYTDYDREFDDEYEYDDIDEDFISIEDIDPESLSYDPFK